MPTDANTDQLAQHWLAQVAADRAVSCAGCLIAHEVAVNADGRDEVVLKMRTVVREHAEDGITGDDVRAGIANLQQRGHIEVDRDGRCWKINLVRKMMFEKAQR